jgi:hypothetical protein
MKVKTSVAAFGLVMMSVVHPSLFAKGRTVKITIKGAGLTTPLEITDPEVEQFSVWAGPRVFVNGVEEREGFVYQLVEGHRFGTTDRASALRSAILCRLQHGRVWLPHERAVSRLYGFLRL